MTMVERLNFVWKSYIIFSDSIYGCACFLNVYNSATFHGRPRPKGGMAFALHKGDALFNTVVEGL